MRAVLLVLALLQADSVTLEEGARLRAGPDEHTRSLALLDTALTLPVLERRGDWVRVRWEGLEGWVRPGHEDGAKLLEQPEPAPPPDAAADPAQLARRLLGAGATERTLSGVALLTDVGDPAVLEPLERVAPSVLETYRSRPGLDPGPSKGEVLVLFARESSLRAFRSASQQRALALGAEGHDPDEVRAAFVRAFARLLTRRANLRVGAWLEEGLALDLAWCRVDQAGRLLPGTFSVSAARTVAELLEARRKGALPRRDRLLTLVSGAPAPLVESPSSRYGALSALAVRFLLDGEKGHRAPAFRMMLDGARSGGRASVGTLVQMLNGQVGRVVSAQLPGRDVLTLEELERRFSTWLSMLKVP